MVGGLAALSLLAAACGDDDDDAADDDPETTTTAEDSGGGGELVGAKGTTPAPETTDAVRDFQSRMDAHAEEAGINLDGTYAYGPEAYDSTIIIALAAQVAGTDGSAHAGEIVNVTKDGEQCSTFAECLALVEAGTDIDYEGVSGPTNMSGNGEPIIGSYAVQVYGDDNRLDPEQETFVTVEASEEFKAMPVDAVEVDRAGDGILKIGTLLPETGNLAFLGPPEIAGVQMAVAEINEAGGVNGAPVELVEGDSGDTTTDTAVQTVTRELAEGVDAIIGAASSSVSASVIDQIVERGRDDVLACQHLQAVLGLPRPRALLPPRAVRHPAGPGAGRGHRRRRQRLARHRELRRRLRQRSRRRPGSVVHGRRW